MPQISVCHMKAALMGLLQLNYQRIAECFKGVYNIFHMYIHIYEVCIYVLHFTNKKSVSDLASSQSH